MADTSKRGTILIVAVICVGALLLVSAAIPAWQEYQRAAGPGGDLPGLPSAGTPGKDLSSPSDPLSPSAATPGKDLSFPSDPLSPSAGPAALSAPAEDDPILGTWTGTKSVTLFFVSANGDATATFRNDYTGDISGEFHGAGMNEVFASGFVWQNNGGGRYTGSIGTDSVEFILQGDTLSMTINPKELGLNDLLDLDIPVEMHRV